MAIKLIFDDKENFILTRREDGKGFELNLASFMFFGIADYYIKAINKTENSITLWDDVCGVKVWQPHIFFTIGRDDFILCHVLTWAPDSLLKIVNTDGEILWERKD